MLMRFTSIDQTSFAYDDVLTLISWNPRTGLGTMRGARLPWTVVVSVTALRGSGIRDTPPFGSRFDATVLWRPKNALAFRLRACADVQLQLPLSPRSKMV
jgi:hypothetical protein